MKTIPPSTSQRAGVVLLITLGVITALATIILAGASQLNRYYDEATLTKEILQYDILSSDLKKIIADNMVDIENATDLYYATLMPYQLDDDKYDLHLSISCESAASAFPVNCLKEKIGSEKYNRCYNNITRLFEKVGVEYPGLLANILADLIDTDRDEREPGSEMAIERPWVREGPIEKRSRLENAIRYYAFKSGDLSILKRDIMRYLGTQEENEMDLNYLDPVLITALAPDLTIQEAKTFYLTKRPVEKWDDTGFSTEIIAQLKSAGVKCYIPILSCAAMIGHNDFRGKTKFEYDIAKGFFDRPETTFFQIKK